MKKAIFAAVITLISGIVAELLLDSINLHYGSIFSIAVMGAFIICEIDKKREK